MDALSKASCTEALGRAVENNIGCIRKSSQTTGSKAKVVLGFFADADLATPSCSTRNPLLRSYNNPRTLFKQCDFLAGDQPT